MLTGPGSASAANMLYQEPVTPLEIATRRASQVRILIAQHLRLIEHLEADGGAVPVAEARRMLPRMERLLQSMEAEVVAEAAKSGE